MYRIYLFLDYFCIFLDYIYTPFAALFVILQQCSRLLTNKVIKYKPKDKWKKEHYY